MLYRTLHNPFLCTINPFPHSSSSQGMEPLKSEFLPETPSLGEDIWAGNGAGGAGDDLCVDQFLDFSNGASELEEQLPSPSPSPEEKKKVLLVSPKKETVTGVDAGVFDGKDDFGSLHESQLSVEAEGLESLEWLSHFVEDSFPDYSLAGKLVPPKTEKTSEPAAAPEPEQPCFVTPLQTKARTKRARTGVRVWPVLSHSLVESSSSSISSSSSTASFSAPNLWLGPAHSGDPKPAKKPKKKPAADGVVAAAQPRKCSHCGVTKTPQWRAGPLGSKTLCNACGVRFKSGRLLPEYRPACSPTFSSEIHSNNHRKVLEMRRKKEETSDAAGPLPQTAVPVPVRSF